MAGRRRRGAKREDAIRTSTVGLVAERAPTWDDRGRPVVDPTVADGQFSRTASDGRIQCWSTNKWVAMSCDTVSG
jgi:hypothetical protein